MRNFFLSGLLVATRDEQGFTLVELLITMVILGVIIAALAAAVISMLHNSNATTQRLAESHDAQMSAAYFASDVQSADVTGTVAPFVDAGTKCDQGNTHLLSLGWSEYDASGNVVAYKLASYSTSSGAQKILYRNLCKGTSYATLSSTPVSTVVVSYYVVTPVAAPTYVTCADGSAKAIALTIQEQPIPGAESYSFQVSGTRRAATC